MELLKRSKIFKSTVCLLLTLTILVSCTLLTAFVSAADNDENGIQPYFTVIDHYTCSLKISGISATSTAQLTAGSSTSLSVKMELQKLKSGVYTTVETWTNNKTGYSISMSEKRTINIFSDYRLKVTFTAGGETSIAYAYPV